jgi:hypothetical protein
MQGLWVEASHALAELADAAGDAELAKRARANAERTRTATEQTYWLPASGFYAFATRLPTDKPSTAEPGPNRDVRQARLDELSRARIVDEDTVLPAVPLWFGTLADERAQSEIDHLGSGHIATDWGARIITDESRLYDPLSYHYGSVWPLFTGWASMGAYRYGRPHVGFQALMSNVLLTYTNALGYVTELLSGDFNSPFGRSSHHQVWSEAMVITPTLRGMLGLEVGAGGTSLRFAPQLPADWDWVEARNIAAGPNARFDFSFARTRGRITIRVTGRGAAQAASDAVGVKVVRLLVAPAFPLDARVRRATIEGHSVPFQITRAGDIQRAEVRLALTQPTTDIVFTYDEGTDVYLEPEMLQPGQQSEGLRVVRARAEKNALHLLLEGRGGNSYTLRVRTPRGLVETSRVKIQRDGSDDPRLIVRLDGASGAYARGELNVPLLRANQIPRRR